MKIENNDFILPDAKRLNTVIYPSNTAYNAVTQEKAKGKSFADVLNGKINEGAKEIQFSKHANTRLVSRDISLSNEQLKRVSDGVEQAEVKGVKDSLVLVDNVALVVNIKSRTVITAVDNCQADKNIFTNIDGAVIV